MNKKILLASSVLGLLASTLMVSAAEEVKMLDSNGLVEFIPDSTPTTPIDPENPEIPVEPIDPTEPDGKPNPGTGGPLSIDFSSSFDFGINKISNQDQIYFARAQKVNIGGELVDRPNYVQISDNRGTNAGWTLKVKQNDQFTAEAVTLNDTLTGSVITLSAPTVNSSSTSDAPTATTTIVLDPEGSESIVMSASQNEGVGTWTDAWGTVVSVTEQDKDGNDVVVPVTKEVTLEVPGATPKDAVKYQTVLTWILSDTPANK